MCSRSFVRESSSWSSSFSFRISDSSPYLSSLLMGSLARVFFLRKVCGNSAENSWKFVKTCVLLRQERVRKFCGKFAEISRKVADIFLQCPLPGRHHKLIADYRKDVYTPARKYYIHASSFSGFVSSRLESMSVTQTCLSGMNFPKITWHVFVCDSENYIEKSFWLQFLENLISFAMIKERFWNFHRRQNHYSPQIILVN